MSRKASLIERMGGAEAASGFLISAVEVFYFKLVTDPVLAKFFEGIDVEKLKRKQVDFLAYVFGGPDDYNGKGIFEAHEHLIREKGLNEIHFDIVAAHFRDTLYELNAGIDLIDEACSILMSARPVFERRPSAEPHSDDSSHGGMANITAVAGQVQELLLTQDDELVKTRYEVKKLVSRSNDNDLERLKAALRMRGPGLVELLDQALEQT